jgi:predicted RNA binding protein YcfA (HicA-like mRNA interferase family)
VKLPRDVSGDGLAHGLASLGYEITRQTGSHLRLTTTQHGEHHLTIPRHAALRVGTLAAIIAEVGRHFGMDRDELIGRVFGG